MIEQEITEFIAANKVATICCCIGDVPYCFNALYTVFDRQGAIVFKSSANTKHGDILTQNNKVAGTILPDNFEPEAIRGIQFDGVAYEEDEDSLTPAASAYYLKYPIAMAMPGKIWIIEFQSVKFTDNSKGFGYKRSWKKLEEELAL